jgi:hypothetical protein
MLLPRRLDLPSWRIQSCYQDNTHQVRYYASKVGRVYNTLTGRYNHIELFHPLQSSIEPHSSNPETCGVLHPSLLCAEQAPLAEMAHIHTVFLHCRVGAHLRSFLQI